ncbi:MAG: SAM-dependent methyltransferase [Bacteroidales bacterium]|jgi:16S rRNA (cytidine1402-2'-O)-methyltransferase|nr:SAM-dependent methyltransferase [Bacteroidales bacterium]
MKGKIFMVPVTIGNSDHLMTIPQVTREITASLRVFAVEDVRSARRYLRSIDREFPVDDTLFIPIGKHSEPAALNELFSRVSEGMDAGVMSEAGMPGLADPGNMVIEEAHRRAIKVVPLTGPSSIMLALVASGMNGQSFSFNGYLPVDPQARRKAIADLERRSATGQTQIFMETPFRNDRMLDDILKVCNPSTRLCIAADITMSTESIITRSVEGWLRERPDIDKKPVVFLLLA